MEGVTCSAIPLQCGLDRGPRAPKGDFQLQLGVFEQQLQLAQELQRPVSVSNRTCGMRCTAACLCLECKEVSCGPGAACPPCAGALRACLWRCARLAAAAGHYSSSRVAFLDRRRGDDCGSGAAAKCLLLALWPPHQADAAQSAANGELGAGRAVVPGVLVVVMALREGPSGVGCARLSILWLRHDNNL